jgi:hypothetical protein
VRNDDIALSEAELLAMTADMEALHHDVSMPALWNAVEEWNDDLQAATPKATSRRRFLLGTGGALAGGAALALFAGTPGLAAAARPAAASSTSNSRGGLGGLSGDLAVAGLAASLENLAVYAYKAGISAAQANKLGSVPPAVVTFATTALSQHQAHSAAWNSLLTANHKHKVTITEPTLTPVVQQQFAQVTNVGGLAELALTLENVAAQTYQAEASRLHSAKAVAVASTIAPVEMQHAAILYFALGKYPGTQDASGNPLAFNPTSLAA